MFDLKDLRMFVEVADAGGLTAAARRLGLSKSIVSRRLLGLEEKLGVQLLARTTRGAVLTEVLGFGGCRMLRGPGGRFVGAAWGSR